MNGDKKENNKYKDALKSVVKPLLIVLRREIRAGNKKLLEHFEGRPDVQKSEVTNHPTKIDVGNFPEQIKAEITNPQKEVDVKGIKDHFADLGKKIISVPAPITKAIDGMKSSIEKILKGTLTVKITNQKDVKFPKVQNVKLSDKDINAIIKGVKQEVQKVQIQNSTPGEAVPVVLAEKTLKRFYDLTVQITGGGGGRANPRTPKGIFGPVSITTTATLIQPDSDRRRNSVKITNNSAQTVFIGFDDTVTPDNGFPLEKNDVLEFNQGDLYSGAIFGIVSAATADVRFMEF